ncbi:phospho-sugar mutase [Cytobacillus firmus]|uniref:phospho-sugar mutase n=1 Tax=Cytobacillus firmus TaxID=1399 RepID=UPI002495A136|nr:phospho-sugar mutase [Cytobacillus firmus]
MTWKSKAEKWLSHKDLDQSLRNLLLNMDQHILEDCFYKDLEFGTGGIRGELGPGTNRLNVYTVRKAAKGLAYYISQKGEMAKKRGIVIAYDCRRKSKEFAMEVAKTVGKEGIYVYLFNDLRPTPELSFAVRYLNAAAGVVITASHNPPEYNGFKVYGEDGGQITPSAAEEITRFINSIENELSIGILDENSLLNDGLLTYIGEELDLAYLEKLKTIQINRDMIKKAGEDLRIVFSPLHGTAQNLVYSGLLASGFRNITIVQEQKDPDPEFPTVKSPNPEEHDAFELAIQYGKRNDADILMATDPDSDRLGVAAKKENGEYAILTGNQMGALMLYYLLSQKKKKGNLPNNGVVLKTIVTSDIGRVIAEDFGISTIDTLTGFKYIGEKIKEFEKTKKYSFLFGYEESYGYLISDFVRDKDAVQAAVFAAEVVAFYKLEGKTLFDGLNEIYNKYGYYHDSLKTLTLKGINGSKKISAVMNAFRENPHRKIGDIEIKVIEDFNTSKRRDLFTGEETLITLPKSNVLKFYLNDHSWFTLRPSGTEPKIKFYFSVKTSCMNNSKKLLMNIEETVLKMAEEIIE